MKRAFFTLLLLIGINFVLLAQNYDLSSKVYSHSLNGDIPSALKLLEGLGENLSEEDQLFKDEFELRFKEEMDQSDYLKDENTPLTELHAMFRDYWRKSLLNPGENYMGELGGKVVPFLMTNYPPIREVQFNRDSIGFYLSGYIHSLGLYTQEEVDVSGHLLDLMVWQNQSDTLYSFDVNGKELAIKVRRMRGFKTLGWREYATLGTHYPGGWATTEALYMVEKAYDTNSEEFRVSFLAHEGMHYLDLKEFPDLENVDLEYRAKLSELSLADSTMFELIEFFINNSDPNSEVPHSVANHRLINQLSLGIFKDEFNDDIEVWKRVSKSEINRVSKQLLFEDTSKKKELKK
tara:strand:- start:10523 stop:11569 length:1047 start_codon:yes stop_codon:yes gene_type:complete